MPSSMRPAASSTMVVRCLSYSWSFAEKAANAFCSAGGVPLSAFRRGVVVTIRVLTVTAFIMQPRAVGPKRYSQANFQTTAES